MNSETSCDNGMGETKSRGVYDDQKCCFEGRIAVKFADRISAAENALLECYRDKWIAGGSLTKLQALVQFALEDQEEENNG